MMNELSGSDECLFKEQRQDRVSAAPDNKVAGAGNQMQSHIR